LIADTDDESVQAQVRVTFVFGLSFWPLHFIVSLLFLSVLCLLVDINSSNRYRDTSTMITVCVV